MSRRDTEMIKRIKYSILLNTYQRVCILVRYDTLIFKFKYSYELNHEKSYKILIVPIWVTKNTYHNFLLQFQLYNINVEFVF